jgi:hypothetical protein
MLSLPCGGWRSPPGGIAALHTRSALRLDTLPSTALLLESSSPLRSDRPQITARTLAHRARLATPRAAPGRQGDSRRIAYGGLISARSGLPRPRSPRRFGCDGVGHVGRHHRGRHRARAHPGAVISVAGQGSRVYTSPAVGVPEQTPSVIAAFPSGAGRRPERSATPEIFYASAAARASRTTSQKCWAGG